MLHEDFRAWSYGPVLQSVHDRFSVLGSRRIRKHAKDAAGHSFMINETAYPELKSALNRVWDAAKNISAVDLSRITQSPNPAWKAAYLTPSSPMNHQLIIADTAYLNRLGFEPFVA
jgi:uncharacterized phage-associated protein